MTLSRVALLKSRLSMDPDERMDEAPITCDPPNPINPPSGCRFRTRCEFAEGVCEKLSPRMPKGAGPEVHATACHMYDPQSAHSRVGKVPPAFEQPAVAVADPAQAPRVASAKA